MNVKTPTTLKELTTMHLGGPVAMAVTVTSVDELVGTIERLRASSIRFVTLGWGSNLIARDDGYDGAIIVNRIGGFEVLPNDGTTIRLRVGGGESLDATVARTVEMGLGGIECLSAIPGTVGAAPVQNAGAYGQEIGEVVESLEALDTTTMQMVSLSAGDCGFSYRDSAFKHNDKRFIITAVIMRLTQRQPSPPFYASLQKYLDEHNITYYTLQTIRDAVIAIRADKLPNPILTPNAGSFFKNPIVEEWLVNDLRTTYPELPAHSMGEDKYKIPAGWLIEQSGLKGYSDGTFTVHLQNALVITNSGSGTYAGLASLRTLIMNTVRDKFRISLEQEPEELG